MEGKITECPKELSNHPVFMVNQKVAKNAIKKNAKVKSEFSIGRSKIPQTNRYSFVRQLKTLRERNAERLIRQSKKWEREHHIYEEREREREAEMKIREMQLLASEGKFNAKQESRGIKLLNLQDKQRKSGQIDLENFLRKENDLMTNRMKSNEKKFDPFTKDLRMVDAR